IEDFVILERAQEIGGTWRDNSYPDVAVDIPSFSYQFSFEPNPSWSRVFAKGAEVEQYAEHCVDKYGLRPHLCFGSEVVKRSWDEKNHLWHLTLRDREVTSRFVITALGAFVDAKDSDNPGVGSFRGKLILSQLWDHDYDLTGKRVAVIGTGSTAVQMIPPVADQAKQLHVFQRRPIWVFAKPDLEISPRTQKLFARVPLLQRAVRVVTSAAIEFVLVGITVYGKRVRLFSDIPALACKAFLYTQIRDPELRKRLTPGYGFGCKRPSMSNRYYKTFTEQHVELVTDRIECVTPTGIRTTDGKERELDVLILATGFRMAHDPESFRRAPVSGRNGFDLADFYTNEPLQAYEGVSLPQLPNTFMIFGPYSWTGSSWHIMVEAQSHHAVRVILESRRRQATAASVRPEANDRFFKFIRRRSRNSLLYSDRCGTANTYYFDHHGDFSLLRPTTSIESTRASHNFSRDDYLYERQPALQIESSSEADAAAE
ncbi:MAG: putative monooxygenase, partial [Myxococcaceae bacterium]|nr:putative monooxygenase [Myxococcaceae bacterium]